MDDTARTPEDPVIFLEKVRRPTLHGLVRERLDRRVAELRQSGQECSLVLVLAPPGAGKTTLLGQLADCSGLPVAWYRASAEDASEVALTRHLGYAIGSALAEPAVIEAARSGRVADLLRHLDRPEVGSVQVVIDDLHELAGSEAERALETFTRLRPRTIRMALGSRRQPGLNTSRLLVSGELVQFDGEDLRFRSWEVEQLFRSVYGTPLAPEASAALTRRTGGWAAGLQLFHLATLHLGRAERERAITDLTGRSRLIRSYLARNVLDGLAPERRRFLLVSAALGVLTGDLCDALLDRHGSAAVLAELEREQFFTTSTDDGLTYHYHQVLQTHLEVLLVDELGGRSARELYSRSGLLLEDAGRVCEAVRAHARAEDWGAVARLMRPGTSLVDGDDTLWQMLSRPGAPTDDPGLALAGARRLARDGQIRTALASFREAERLLDDPGFGRRCAAERQAVAVWLPLSSGSALPPLPISADAEARLMRLSIELRRLTRDVRRPQSFERGWVRALAYVVAGDLSAAEYELPRGRGGTGTADAAWAPAAADLVECLVRATRSPDDDLAGRVETITLTAEIDGWPWLARLGRSLLAVIQLSGSDEPWRVAAAADLLDSLAAGPDRWTHLVASVGIGLAATRIPDPALAQIAHETARRLAAELGAPALVAALDREATPTPTHQQTRPTPPSGRSPAATIEVTCLGTFGLRVGTVEVDWRGLRPRARHLLMLLAVNHGHPRHREMIIEALWPEASVSSGIRSLQVAVSSVRQCLTGAGVPGDPIRRQGDAYELVLPSARSDLAEFERRADEARRLRGVEALRVRQSALDLYRGELLPEVGPADWLVEERDRLRLLAAAVAAAAAADAVAAGDLGAAAELARRSVTLDACHDPAWRLMVDAYERLGDLSAAAVARADHRRVWDELGLVVPAAGGAFTRSSV